MSNYEPPVYAAAPKKLPVQKLGNHISIFKLYGLCIGNLLLNIITLGIYSFWGRTRIRKYNASHITLAKSPFEYTGTGKELFFGFLKAYGVLIVFFGIVALLAEISGFVGFLGFLAFYPLLLAGIYMSVRYRLSRLTWKAIRFRLGGSAFEFAKKVILNFLLTMVTLGYFLPKFQVDMWGNITNNAYFGNLNFQYRGDYKKLMKIHLKTFGICLLMFIPGFILMILASVLSKVLHSESWNLLVLPGWVLIGLSRIPRYWYKAELWQHQVGGLRLGGLRFKSKATGMDFFKLSFVNLLLLIFTLGLAYPLVIARKMRFHTKFLLIAGNVDDILVSQAPKDITGIGDMVATELDIGGLDLGL